MAVGNPMCNYLANPNGYLHGFKACTRVSWVTRHCRARSTSIAIIIQADFGNRKLNYLRNGNSYRHRCAANSASLRVDKHVRRRCCGSFTSHLQDGYQNAEVEITAESQRTSICDTIFRQVHPYRNAWNWLRSRVDIFYGFPDVSVTGGHLANPTWWTNDTDVWNGVDICNSL